MKHPKLKILAVSSLLLIATTTGFSLLHKDSISALDNNFSNGITVDSTLDTPDANIGDTICDDGAGHCTLRAAIQEANSNPDHSTILFNIPGAGVHTILLNSSIPEINEQVTINGYSQPGATPNTNPAPQPLNGTLLIELDGSNAGDARGLIFNTGGSGSTVSGLVINRFQGSGITLQDVSVSNLTVAGNYIGTSTDGLTGLGNGVHGITLDTDTVDNLVVGGQDPAARNIISGQVAGGGINSGPEMMGTFLLEGNYIGMASDGLTDIGNAGGATMGGESNVIDNLISGNDQLNLSTSTSGGRVSGNLIGTNYMGQIDSNIQQGMGVTVNQSAFNLLIGGTSASEKNIIAGNSVAGVVVVEVSLPFPLLLTPTKVSIVGNSIFGNSTGQYPGWPDVLPGLGIDHMQSVLDDNFSPQTSSSNGPTPNDPSDSDTGPNNYINFPILNSVTQDGTNATINFNLDAADSPTNQYRIEFFANDQADPSGYGEGQTFLGYTTVSNGTNQLANLTLPSGLNLSNKSISATTTAIDNTTNSGFGSTSEFSPIVLASVTNPPTNPPTNSNQSTNTNTNLASTGSNTTAYALLAASLLLVSTILLVRNRSSF